MKTIYQVVALAAVLRLAISTLAQSCDPQIPVSISFTPSVEFGAAKIRYAPAVGIYTIRVRCESGEIQCPIEATADEGPFYPATLPTQVLTIYKKIHEPFLVTVNCDESGVFWDATIEVSTPSDCAVVRRIIPQPYKNRYADFTPHETIFVLEPQEGSLTCSAQTTVGETAGTPCQSGAFASFPADDTTRIHITGPDNVGTLQWCLRGDSLGCTLSSIGPYEAILTPGDEAGKVTVVASSSGGCTYATSILLEDKKKECDTCDRFSAVTADVGSISVKVHLGKDRYVHDAGYVYLKRQTVPTSTGDRLTRRASFKCLFEQFEGFMHHRADYPGTSGLPDNNGYLPNCRVIKHPTETSDATPYQVVVPTGVVVIDTVKRLDGTINPDQLIINSYALDTVGLGTTEQTAPILIPSGARPATSVLLQNPDATYPATTTEFDKLDVSITYNGTLGQSDTTTHIFHYEYNGTAWQLHSDGSDQRLEASDRIIGGERIRERKSQRQVAGSPGTYGDTTYERVRYQNLGGAWRRAEVVVGSDSTTYEYYNAPGTDNHQRLRKISYPDGTWEYFASYDSDGRLTKKVLPFNNAPCLSTPSETLCRVEEYNYDPLVGDNVNLEWGTPRRIIHKVMGVETGRTYWQISDAGNILTRTRYDAWAAVPDGSDPDSAPELYLATVSQFRYVPWTQAQPIPESVQNPDGTYSLYTYRHSTRDPLVAPSNPNAYTIDDSKEYENAPGSWNGATLLVREEQGYYDGELGSVTTSIRDSQTGLLGERQLEAEYRLVSGTTFTTTKLDSFAYQTIQGASDPLRQSYWKTSLDGSVEKRGFDCCGMTTEIDKEQTMTSYVVDEWNRRTAVQQYFHNVSQPVVTSYMLDINGRVLLETRFGTQTGQDFVLNQYKYDLSGRIEKHTNTVLGETTYSYQRNGSGKTVTATFPDGGVRREETHFDGTRHKVSGSAVAETTWTRGVEDPDGAGGALPSMEYELEERPATRGGVASEGTKSYYDGLGRLAARQRSGQGSSLHRWYYNSKGQLWKEVDPDGVVTLYGYNEKGEREATAIANLSASRPSSTGDEADYAYILPNVDRVQKAVTSIATRQVVDGGGTRTVQVMRTVRSENTSPSGVFVNVAKDEVAVGGRTNWHTVYPVSGQSVTTTTVTEYLAGGGRSVTVIAPDGSRRSSSYLDGQLLGEAQEDANGNTLDSVAYRYSDDLHHRLCKSYSLRSGNTVIQYWPGSDLVQTVTSPAPGNGQPAQPRSMSYDSMMRLSSSTEADQAVTKYFYYPSGLLKLVYGGRQYATGYAYDAQLRTTKMLTWEAFPGETAALAQVDSLSTTPAVTGSLTTWSYNTLGMLAGKTDANGQGPAYMYTTGGRPYTREWQRVVPNTSTRTKVTYLYDFSTSVPASERYAFGDLARVEYNDGTTPPVRYEYDRQGKPKTIKQYNPTDASKYMTASLGFNDAALLTSESYASTEPRWLAGVGITLEYDSYLRRHYQRTFKGAAEAAYQHYDFYEGYRLKQLDDGTKAAKYTYLPNSSLVDTFTQGTWNGSVLTSVLKATRQYDLLNRLQQQSAIIGTATTPAFKHVYEYNAANQRTRATLADGSAWVYGYDGLGQVNYGHRFWADGKPVAGQQMDYTFDTIGNRTATKTGGDANGANQRSATYTPQGADSQHRVNQYASRTVPRYLEMQGVAYANVAVTVSGTTPYALTPTVTRQGEYFRAELSFTDNNAVSEHITVNVPGGTLKEGDLFLPPNPEVYQHDADGNLTQDGRWDYTWDAENRLVKMTSRTGAGPERRVEFEYDWQGRRIAKRAYNSRTGTTAVISRRYLYDGWNLVAELDALASDKVVRLFFWGLDLSGTLAGAGGVGGLAMVRDCSPATPVTYFPAYDGNGNVVGLVAADGTPSARYDYGPFGEPLRTSGTMALTNPFRFSTKYTDDETDLVYYGYRYYSPNTGRWISRDPLGEVGGPNLLEPFFNNPLTYVDRNGLDNWANPGAGQNAPPAMLNVQAFVDPSTGDNSSAYSVGWNHLAGNLGPSLSLSGHDKMAEQMRSSQEAAESRRRLKAAMKQGCRVGTSVAFARESGNESKLSYVVGFGNDMLHNPTRAWLGSFHGEATVEGCWGCCAAVRFELHDSKGWRSASHLPPPYGYPPSGRENPALFQAWYAPLAWIAIWGYQLHHDMSLTLPSSIFPDDAFGDYGRTMNATISWKEWLCPDGLYSTK